MKILLTGSAGFIGFYLSKMFLSKGHEVVGLDNINDYYDVNLKFARLKELGIHEREAKVFGKLSYSKTYDNFSFIRLNLEDDSLVALLFKEKKFDIVFNLAAQAGVRYSIENPKAYINSNINGFLNLLEECRNNEVKNFYYASSSSVYGNSKELPFSTKHNVDYPVSLYAATKKSNELMAYTYSHLYNINTIGLRFFTVYGPWGRPDMALFKFTKSILEQKGIDVYNNGNLKRDFTYIDDIINGIDLIVNNTINNNQSLYEIFNIGKGSPESLLDFINAIETNIGIKAKKNFLPMQPGDVYETWADTSEIEKMGYESTTGIGEGVKKFVDWYKDFYKL
ncbi:NAD-dependent epimerase/dehydratase family protein [Corallibacter sp.]|uniref:NAD-dependent epimerase/dehydratase family protein n=1 Tax=Corallibacter sp. TaxID=2038084 RepID=UPI003AB4AFAA